jgi:DNA polymerase-3 subunit beta
MSDTETMERPGKGKGKAPASGAGFAIERDSFLAAISTTKAVVEARNTIPILSNLAITADAARLASAVETLRPGTVQVALGGGELMITQGSSRRRLPTLPAEDFPMIQVGDTVSRFEMPAGVLLSMLNATALSISTEEMRYYLNGVFFHVDRKTLRAASTDGHRLTRVIAELPAGAADMPNIIVARKSVREMRRLLEAVDAKAIIPIEIGNMKLQVRIGNVRLVAKLIDGTFPDYSRTIPTANGKILTVHSAEWARCMRAAIAVCSERTRVVRLNLSERGSEAIGQSPEGGDAMEPIDAEFGPGDLEIGLNGRYAMDLAAVFGDAATLKLAFADPVAPILITSDDKPALTAVLMPMRIGGERG